MKWLKRQWLRFKVWAYAILVSLGLISGGLLYAETVTQSWTNSALRMDGTPLPSQEIAFTHTYCDIDPASYIYLSPPTPTASIAGSAETIDFDLGTGIHECWNAHEDTFGQHSDLSATSKIHTILPARPGPPITDS